MCIRKLAFLALSLLAAGSAMAKTPAAACAASQAEAADAAVDTLNSWAAIATFREKFRQCDDGSIAEGSSEAVARLLVDHWDTLPELSPLIAKTPALRPFVLWHINSTLDTGDLDKIKQNAAHCPNGMQSLCKSIAKAASKASSAP
ncbi:hypothetical protein [Dyella choica]|uniref:hypothetical protein n=1 Tax=Dyella choica TaxID=1927959 RepID=UPI0018AD56EA|nr:hypothetical protein [Dyella choica]